jgi:hypothetical protein
MKNKIYQYDRIIIGGSLASLLCGYCYNIPVVYTTPRIPLFFEADERLGSKSQLWQELSAVMSLSGLLPMGNTVQNIRVEDNTLKAFTEDPVYGYFGFDEVIVFDDTSVDGWDGKIDREKKLMVLDWMNDRGSSPHDVTFLESPDDFVRDVHFYLSDRIFGNPQKKKDILSISRLTEEQIREVEYTDTYARFKVLEMMENSGIKGRKNGIDKKTGRGKNLSIKLETASRDVHPVFREPFSEEKLLRLYEEEPSQNKYIRTLRKYLHG